MAALGNVLAALAKEAKGDWAAKGAQNVLDRLSHCKDSDSAFLLGMALVALGRREHIPLLGDLLKWPDARLNRDQIILRLAELQAAPPERFAAFNQENAYSAGISVATLKRWMQLPEFKAAYLQVRWEVVFQTNARIQQNSGVAASVLFKLMADPITPASVRARTAQRILECAIKSLELEDMEVRLAALERATEESRQGR